MKFIIIYMLTVFALFSNNVKGQVTDPPYFDTCQYLRPLQGEWMNVNGNDTIRVYLRFHRNFDADAETYNSTIDELWGWVEYKKGSTIVMSDYANRFAPLPYDLENLTPGLRSIVVSTGKDRCTNPQIKLYGILRDILRCRQAKELTATVNTQGTQMAWKLVQPTALVDREWCGGLTLPGEFILIKQ